MKRIVTAVALVLATTLAAVPALADGNGGDQAATFPMPAATFQQRVDARIARGRARIEKLIVEKKFDANKAQEIRSGFDARTQKIEAAATDAEKDGVVTKEEARAVHMAAGPRPGARGSCEHEKS